jgi:porphobilinogen synthase
MAANFPTSRLRRLRQHPKIRDLVREHDVHVNDLIAPLFVKQGLTGKKEISSMPGQYQLGLDALAAEIKTIVALKIPAIILFAIPEHKDATGSDAFAEDGIALQAIRLIRKTAPELLIISDICCCEYTDHGHCGVMDEHTGCMDLNNDATLPLLQKQVVAHAKAGSDVMAPSGNIDGMVQAIRSALDDNDFKHIPILSYTAKYASSFYGPFRDAAESAASFGDRRSHQLDVANANEALREAEQDVDEGADMLMVKPAMPYLDVMLRLKQTHPALPLCAYQVSGEYAMLKAASQQGWLDEQACVLESLVSMKRAGANMIITYYAKQVATWLG